MGRCRRGAALGLVLLAFAASAADAPAPLRAEARIALGEVRGRIDHLAIDTVRRRLFVAELGNGTVAAVDLTRGAVAQRLAGLEEPQGVGWSAASGRLYVASAGDGKLTAFAGDPLKPVADVRLGEDADNVRLAPATHEVVVGFGRGALATLDEASFERRADIPVGGHPESFQLESTQSRAFVNVPAAHRIVVIDRAARRVVDRWPTPGLADNFPLALDERAARLYAAFRQPAVLGAFSTRDGALLARQPACGDADDVFVDDRRRRVYVICGEGRVDIFDVMSDKLEKIGSIATVPGARTGLWSPELDRLYVAVRASTGQPAAIWVLAPVD